MTAIFVISLALLTFTLFFLTFRNRRRHAAERGLLPLDLGAFHTLMDREDERFLRLNLSHSQFTHMKRRRIGVTWKYVNRISDNSAAVLRMAGAERQNADPNVAEAAAHVADLATRIRMQCLLAFVKLAVEYAVPAAQLSPAKLAPTYESLQQNLSILRSLSPNTPLWVPA